MLRLSKLTDYGTVVLADMAGHPDNVHTASELAERTHIGLPTVSKLMKLFARGGLVRSYRGARGGYQLTRAPEQINAVQIIDAVEGPIAITECSASNGNCTLEPICAVGRNWQLISQSIRSSLKDISLADLCGAMPPSPVNVRLPRQTGRIPT